MTDGDGAIVGWGQHELVPARMVNEFTYCPRLFYLEWVQARFADNDDTVEGRWEHRAVDEETRADIDGDEERPQIVRSLLLSSQGLGVVCRVDLVEINGSTAVPVDYKRGAPPDNAERSWEPERVQLCLQGLILREAGYQCDGGVLYFTGAKTRVPVPFTEALLERTHEILQELRVVAGSSQAPEPLVDSAKCPRCSLVGLCLPDETNLLSGRSGRAPRRLIPSDVNGRPLYVAEPGARIGKSRGRIEVVRDGETLASVRPVDVSQICVFGNVQISTQLINAMLREGIPICWFSHGGWFNGMAHQPGGKHVELRMRQVARASTGRIDIAERRLAQEVTHPIFGYRVSYRRVLEVQSRLLAAYLLGEIETYTSFTTR